MSPWSVNLVSAFGRGESLALALNQSGFQVKVLDFTNAFGAEYDRGWGPFPLADKTFLPAQKAWLKDVESQPQGLTFWLASGPVELTGPFAGVHIHSCAAVQAWKTNDMSADFDKTWLLCFLRQWAAPVHSDSWAPNANPIFPGEAGIGVCQATPSFEAARAKAIEVVHCHQLRGAAVQSQRLSEIETDQGTVGAQQWIWCLSGRESKTFGAEASAKIFGRSLAEPAWAWLSFSAKMQKGPWTGGLPQTVNLIGDVFLPWTHANAVVLQRLDETRVRAWLKVPRALVGEIDARRGWALDLQRLLQQRLALADWKVDSAEWSICPHSEVFVERPQRLNQWKNRHLIAPEVLPRLDLSARLELEAEVFCRLERWRNEQMKKQGGRRDQALHPA